MTICRKDERGIKDMAQTGFYSLLEFKHLHTSREVCVCLKVGMVYKRRN